LLHVFTKETNKNDIKKIENNSELLLSDFKNISDLRIESSENPTQSVSELTAEYDLLIIGTPKKDTFKSMLFGTGKDKFASNSSCSVLRLTINN
jgi:hypothetical protein